MKRVVVDANVAFRALASSRGDIRGKLDPVDGVLFITPRFLFVELFKHKDRIVRASKKSEDDVLESLHALVAAMESMDESASPIDRWLEARRLCAPTDPKDTRYVALALYVDGELGTEDDTTSL